MATRISEEAAKELFLRNDLKPLEPFPGTQKPWRSRCPRSKTVQISRDVGLGLRTYL